MAGQQLGLHYSLVGFEMDKKTKTHRRDGHRSACWTTRASRSLAKPLTGDIKSDDKDAPGVMIFHPYLIELNRPGKFKVELTAKCNVSDRRRPRKSWT